VAWQTAQGNHIPPNAIVIGSTVNGEKLYMGRTLHDGTLTPGKVILFINFKQLIFYIRFKLIFLSFPYLFAQIVI